jgi:hypothetical protein
MLFKFAIKMLVFVTIARWLYAEAALVAPESIPTLDRVLAVVQIPTHDAWPEVDWKEFNLQLHEAIARER